MVKLALSMFIAVLPALALANRDIETRAVSENDLFGRELSEAETIVYARDMEKLFTRMTQEVGNEKLTRRHLPKVIGNILAKVFKHAPKIEKLVGKLSRREDEPKMFVREDAELEGQELDELFEHDLELDLNLLEFEEWEINDLD